MRNFVIKLSQKPLVISGPSAAGKVSKAFDWPGFLSLWMKKGLNIFSLPC